MDMNAFIAAVEKHETAHLAVTLSVGDRKLQYLTPNKSCLWRAQTLLSKEPDTIAWLNSLPEGGVLLDVGANVGMYSVYAGVMRNARVYAFEPEAHNYALLCGNLRLNGLDQRALAWCAALSDETKFDRIFLSSTSPGGSCHSFAEQVDPYLRPQAFSFAQGSYATTVDALVAAGAMEVPTFIKIDVDGLEHKIIKGAMQTLQDRAVRSLLVEINSRVPEHMAIVDALGALGFTHDPDQFARAQRKEGYFEGVGEYVFRR